MLIVSLFAITSPAQAAVEAVAPTSTQLICTSSELGCSGAPAYYDGVGDFPFFIKYTFETAQTWCSSKNLEWNYLSNVDPYGGFAAYYRCDKWVFALINAPCPTATPAYIFNPASGMCERPAQVTCPIPEFPDINESDACTKSLEKGKGKDVENACEALDSEMVKQEICLGNKIRRLGIPYFEPSATVRTVAYQQHFVDLWEWQKVKIPDAQKIWSDAEKQKCAPMVAKVEAEWKKHKLRGRPSKSGADAPHVQRKAVDIDEAVVEAMKDKISKSYTIKPASTSCIFCDFVPVYIGDVQDYVNSPLFNPPACKLRWGGRFINNYDPVHFDLFLK